MNDLQSKIPNRMLVEDLHCSTQSIDPEAHEASAVGAFWNQGANGFKVAACELIPKGNQVGENIRSRL